MVREKGGVSMDDQLQGHSLTAAGRTETAWGARESHGQDGQNPLT